MGSRCPIGYMDEHLFHDKRFDVYELVARRAEVPHQFTECHFVDFNSTVISDIHGVGLGESSDISEGEKHEASCIDAIKPVLKGIAKSILPIHMDSGIMQGIHRFRPEVIYTQGYDIRILRVAAALSKQLGIPCVTHTLDYWFSSSAVLRLLQFHALKECLKLGRIHLAGSPSMAEWLRANFSAEAEFISNCAEYGSDDALDHRRSIEKELSEKLVFIYAGNLTPDRHHSLNILANAIGNNGVLKIFSPLEQIRDSNGISHLIEVNNSVDQSQVGELFASADVLVHVESFNPEAIKFTRYSLSTKIAECLAYDVPLLYFGPSEIGVAEFLEENNCGIRAYCAEDLPDAVSCLVTKADRERIVEHQQQVGLRWFERDRTRFRLAECLRKASLSS